MSHQPRSHQIDYSAAATVRMRRVSLTTSTSHSFVVVSDFEATAQIEQLGRILSRPKNRGKARDCGPTSLGRNEAGDFGGAVHHRLIFRN